MLNVERFLAACLRGENPTWPTSTSDEFLTDLLARSSFHGVQALAFERLRLRPQADVADGFVAFKRICRETALSQTMWELRHVELLTRVLNQLAAAGVRPVLFKGTALAYSIYPDRAVRTRGDTDFIVPASSMETLRGALEAQGFERLMAVSGEHISYQATYTWSKVEFGDHSLDVHWRINNSELLSHLFSYDELLSGAQRLPMLGPCALAASPVHALLLACMHRATHKQNPYYVDGVAYYSGDRLIWLYDIHLLLGVLKPAQEEEFVQQARDKGLCAVCLEGIERAQANFHTVVSPAIYSGLTGWRGHEPASQYLCSGPLLQKWMDFRALNDLGQQLTYVKELVFPPISYMRQKYPGTGSFALGLLYLRRALVGFAKYFGKRPGASAH